MIKAGIINYSWAVNILNKLFILFNNLLTSIFIFIPLTVNAAAINFGTFADGSFYIYLNGTIGSGDAYNLIQLTEKIRRSGGKINFIALNSAGGEVAESFRIISYIIANDLPTGVAAGNICLSACFGILAAGKPRYVDSAATVGVHRAGTASMRPDDIYARATSIDMNDIYRYLNVPAAIRLKMLDTPPEQIYYLSAADKEELNNTQPLAVGFGNQNKARSLNQAAVTYIYGKNYPKAVILLEQAKAIYYNDSEILGNLGFAYYMVGDNIRARDNLTAALKLSPQSSVVWNNMGLVLLRENQPEQAVTCLVNYWYYSGNKKAAAELLLYWANNTYDYELARAARRALETITSAY